jgi:hypothetical protein
MMPPRRMALVLVCGFAGSLGAQAVAQRPAAFDDREHLEAAARAAEDAHRTSEAWLLRSRLKNGDFQEGDRIVVVFDANPTAVDTMQVRAGKLLQFPRMSELSLEGVLRSELTDQLRQHLGKYMTNPGVRATPLLPVAVLGSIRNPGFYYAPADVVLRDAIMRAGGPSPDADLGKTVIRRSGQVIWNVDDVRTALAEGLSLDRLHMRAGDEIFIPQERKFGLSNVVTILSAAVAVSVAVVQLQR